MKRKLLMAFVLLIAITACKKEKPPVPEVEDRKPEVIIKEITEKLAGADSISTFTAALKNIALTVAETSQGITVFAPLNQNHNPQGKVGKLASNGGNSGKTSFSSISAVVDTGKTKLTDTELRDHIVKGVFNFNNLTDGKVLTTLNGKELKITRSADTVWLNGVRIGGKQIVSTANEAVFAVKSVLTGTTPTDEPQSTSIELTIWDGTLWTAAKPKGDLAANALVTLYKSQKDYADSVSAYQGTTDATGKVIFKFVSPGDYYIKVNKDFKTNIFYRSAKENGLYKGFASNGIFQSLAEVTAGPMQPSAAPGDFKWLDGNADGVINDNDRVTLPYEKATVTAGSLRKVEVMIGTVKNTQPQPFTETEFNTKLNEVEATVASWHKKLVLIDGLLGPKVTMDSIPQVLNTGGYQAINNFQITPTNQYIEEIWKLGYESISKLTTLEERVPQNADRSARLGSVRVTRAYVYLQLFTYFENISFQRPEGKLNNSKKSEVFSYIVQELMNAPSGLPSNVSAPNVLNSISARAILAKAYLLDKDYSGVVSVTNSIIASGKYSLATKGSEFATGSSEIMWDNSVDMLPPFKSYFYNRASLPYLRLTEVYLMAIEANIALGNTPKAQELFATVCNRSGYFVSPVSMSVLSGLWNQQYAREGNLFISTIRWGNQSIFATRGYINGKHNRLPIPQSVIDTNPDMNQNIQY